jgi:hypothetical protein
MVQIIESNKKPSFGSSLMKGVSQSAPDALGRYFDRQREESARDTENAALEKQGYNLRGVRSPDARKALLEGQGKEKENSRFQQSLNSQPGGFDASKLTDAQIMQAPQQFQNLLYRAREDQKHEQNQQQLRQQKAASEEDEAAREKAVSYEMLEPLVGPEEAYRLSENMKPSEAQNYITKQTKSNKPEKRTGVLGELDKGVSKDIAEVIKSIPEIEAMDKSLNHIDKLIDQMSGPTGYFKAALGTETAATLEALGFAAIKPIIKLFNPVGAIPVAKMNILAKRFAISPWDRTEVAKGKVKALRSFNKLAMNRAERYKELISKYGDAPVPYEELLEFSKENESFIDAIEAGADEFGEPQKETTQDLPSASKNKGRALRDDATGKVYRSDGKNWIPGG